MTIYIYISKCVYNVFAALPPTAACMAYIKSASNVIYIYCDSDSVCAYVSVCHGTGERQV